MLNFVELSKNQFFLTSVFGACFLMLNIGLSTINAIMQTIARKNLVWQRYSKFWLKILFASYNMTIIATIFLVFQLAANWAYLSAIVSSIFGPLILLIAIIMLFIEANLISSKHQNANILNAWIIAFLKLFHMWILVAICTLMIAPQGIEFDYLNYCAKIISFSNMFFNMTIAIKFVYAICISYTMTSLLCITICAYYIIKNQHIAFAINSIKIAVIIGLCASVLLPYLAQFHSQKEIRSVSINIIRIKNGMRGLQAARNLKKEYSLEEKEVFLQHKHDIGHAMLISQLQPTERLVGTSFETVIPTIEEITQEQIEETATKAIANEPVQYKNIISVIHIWIASLFALLSLALLRKKITASKLLLKFASVTLLNSIAALFLSMLCFKATLGPWLIYNILPSYLTASSLLQDTTFSFVALIIFFVASSSIFIIKICNITYDGPIASQKNFIQKQIYAPSVSKKKIKNINVKRIYRAQINSRAVLKKLRAKSPALGIKKRKKVGK